MKKTQVYEWHKREGTIRVNVVEVGKIKREKTFSPEMLPKVLQTLAKVCH